MQKENHTDVQAWSVADVVSSLGEKPSKKQKIIIPKYQRSLVWNDEQKELFIRSIKLGFPIGSLLLYKTGTDENNTIFSLTDGLQRSSTLLDYSKKPTKYFNSDSISTDLIKEVVKFIKPKRRSDDEIKRVVIDWIKQLKGFEESLGFSARTLGDEIDDKLKLELSKERNKQLGIILQPFTEKIKIDADIFDFKIPIVIYTGDEGNLPIIFERLNKQGTQLSKYQIYAATWANDKLKIKNKEIIKLIAKKYQKMINEGLEIENFNSDIDTFSKEDFSVFEYFFGLSKILVEKYPNMFGNEREEESVGFNIGAVCLGIPIKTMNGKQENLSKKFLQTIKLYSQDKFEAALFDSIEIVKGFLKPYVELKANRNRSNKSVIYHTEFQIISFIGKVFKEKYATDFSILPSWKETEKLLRHNAPFHYLYDILKGNWRNSGDSKSLSFANKVRYERPINKWNWNNVLDIWFKSETEKQEKNRANISDTSVLFMKYIYSHLITVHEEFSTKEFEIEHIVPVEKLKILVAGTKGLPISAISNLCLIDKKINRAKGSLTFYEYADEIKGTSEKIKIAEIEKYTFTEKKDLAFAYKKDIKLDAYQEFLKMRFQIVKNKFFEVNKIEGDEPDLFFNFDE